MMKLNHINEKKIISYREHLLHGNCTVQINKYMNDILTYLTTKHQYHSIYSLYLKILLRNFFVTFKVRFLVIDGYYKKEIVHL